MKLKDYLEKCKKPAYQFAGDCGVSPSLIYSIINKKRDIYLSVAVKIARGTNWKIRPEDLIDETILEKRITRTKKVSPKTTLATRKAKKNPDKVSKKNHG